MSEPTELYRKHRPTLFKYVQGQDETIKILTEKLAKKTYPHTSIYAGPSGCGKTTLARIVAKKLGCDDDALFEYNVADVNGINDIRDIRRKMGIRPMIGEVKVYILDEAHQLSREAMEALLKMTEDPPGHVYFMLCTTNPTKLLPTLQSRGMTFKLKAVAQKAVREILQTVCIKEGIQFNAESGSGITEEVLDKIVEVCEGNARKALVELDKVRGLADPEDQLNVIQKADTKRQAFDLVKAMMPFKGRANWSEVTKVLEELGDEESEGIRQLILSCCTTAMLKGGARGAQAFLVYKVFQYDFYTTRKAGLVGACWEVVNGGGA